MCLPFSLLFRRNDARTGLLFNVLTPQRFNVCEARSPLPANAPIGRGSAKLRALKLNGFHPVLHGNWIQVTKFLPVVAHDPSANGENRGSSGPNSELKVLQPGHHPVRVGEPAKNPFGWQTQRRMKNAEGPGANIEHRTPAATARQPANTASNLEQSNRGKAALSHPQATFKPSDWEGIATHKPPSSHPHATYMRPSCDPHATPKPIAPTRIG